MQAKHIIGDFEGVFQGVKTFLTPKLAKKKSRPPREIADYVFFQHKKITSQTVRFSSTLVIFCTGAKSFLNVFLWPLSQYSLPVIVCRRAVLRHEAETEIRIRRVSREGEENRTPSLSLSPGTPTGRADSLRYRTRKAVPRIRNRKDLFPIFGSVSGSVDPKLNEYIIRSELFCLH